MHPREAPDDLKMTEFLCADVHQQIFSSGILAVDALNGILHCSGEFAVGTAALLEQHIAETGIRFIDTDRVHELLYVMIHLTPMLGAGRIGLATCQILHASSVPPVPALVGLRCSRPIHSRSRCATLCATAIQM